MCRSYAAAEPTDLWNGLQEALDNANEIINLPINATVESIMETWSSQSGYPVVNVERNYTTGAVTYSQVIFKEINLKQKYVQYLFIFKAQVLFFLTLITKRLKNSNKDLKVDEDYYTKHAIIITRATKKVPTLFVPL